MYVCHACHNDFLKLFSPIQLSITFLNSEGINRTIKKLFRIETAETFNVSRNVKLFDSSSKEARQYYRVCEKRFVVVYKSRRKKKRQSCVYYSKIN